jgi:ATP phosphoribosyltransferase
VKTLKIAIQKSGRLNEKSVELLKNCGLNFENYKSSLISPVSNFPLEILFLRDDDIPEYVQDGIADLGIVGDNVIQETEVEVAYLQRLGFGKCSLKIAVPITTTYCQPADLNGKAIATTYPVILGKYLKEQGIV